MSNVGNASGYAVIRGLPATSANVGHQSLACSEAANVVTSGLSTTVNGTFQVSDMSSVIRIGTGDGAYAAQWHTGMTYISGSGWYISV